MGLFGSHSRGTGVVGSDLDLLLLDTGATRPQIQRLLHWLLEQLPLSCALLILTPTELDQQLASGSRMAQALQSDLLWLE